MNDAGKRWNRREGGAPSSRSRRHTDRSRPVVAITLLIGLCVLITSNLLVADEPAGTSSGGVEAESSDAAPSAGVGLIPRDAIIDMTRAQSGVICSSEIFLGCMGFDGTTCLSLSESAIDRCLAPLPAEIDPATLDNATLESCPMAVYEEAGYGRLEADACFSKALDEPRFPSDLR